MKQDKVILTDCPERSWKSFKPDLILKMDNFSTIAIEYCGKNYIIDKDCLMAMLVRYGVVKVQGDKNE